MPSTNLNKLTVDHFRIIPRDTSYLDRKTGSKGEIYVDNNTFSLRIFTGDAVGGNELANASLNNVSNSDFLAKATLAGVGTTTSAFKTIAVSGQSNVVADTAEDTLTLVAGDNITITTDASGDSITIASTGGGGNSFTTISIAGQSDVVAEESSDTLTLVAGTGITLTSNAGSDSITVTNSSPASNSFANFATTGQTTISASSLSDTITLVGNNLTITTDEEAKSITFTVPQSVTETFKYISIAGQTTVEADTATDTLTLVAGPNITLTTNAGGDSITISALGEGGGGGGVSTGQINRLAYYAATGSTVSDTGENLQWNGSDLLINGSAVITENTRTTTKFYIAADDSTIRLVQEDESVKFIGGTGISTSSDIDGNITISTSASLASFSTIAVSGQNSVVAELATDTLTLVAGTNVTITTDSATDTITINSTASGGSASNSFANINVSGQNTVVADSSNDTLTLVAGTGISITTDDTADSITIANSSNSFSTVAVAGQSNVEADTVGDTLTLVAGSNITITTTPGSDSVTIASSQIANFSELTDVTTASLRVDKIAYQAIARLIVTNTGSTAYLFNSHYSGSNPTLYALSGTTLAFELNASGHPFLIQTGAGVNYDTGLVHVSTTGTVSTGASAQGKDSGTLYWNIPRSISGGYRYQCGAHAAMVGSITVKDFAAI